MAIERKGWERIGSVLVGSSVGTMLTNPYWRLRLALPLLVIGSVTWFVAARRRRALGSE